MNYKKSQLFCVGIVVVAYYYKYSVCTLLEDEPELEIGSGSVVGATFYSRGGRVFYGYHKIPYALPPTGERRFEVST